MRSPFVRPNLVLNPPQKEKRGKGTEAAANTAKENLKNEAPKPTKTATAAPVQSKFAPVSSPPIRQSSSDDEKGDYESVPSMISSNDRVNINESPSTSTFSPIEIRQGTRRLDPSKITSSVFVPYFDESPGD